LGLVSPTQMKMLPTTTTTIKARKPKKKKQKKKEGKNCRLKKNQQEALATMWHNAKLFLYKIMEKFYFHA